MVVARNGVGTTASRQQLARDIEAEIDAIADIEMQPLFDGREYAGRDPLVVGHDPIGRPAIDVAKRVAGAQQGADPLQHPLRAGPVALMYAEQLAGSPRTRHVR